MDSCLAAWMNPQVLTRTTSASCESSASCQPPSSSRAASSSESTSFRAQPRVTILTLSRWQNLHFAGWTTHRQTTVTGRMPAHQHMRARAQPTSWSCSSSGCSKTVIGVVVSVGLPLAVQVQRRPARVAHLQRDRCPSRSTTLLGMPGRGPMSPWKIDIARRGGQPHPGQAALVGDHTDLYVRRLGMRDRRGHGRRLLGLVVGPRSRLRASAAGC